MGYRYILNGYDRNALRRREETAMLRIAPGIAIPDSEFRWSFVRSSGPGGQNVNKVASKAVLRWDVRNSPSLPAAVKHRLQARKRITTGGELIISSQRYRDQERNRQDCLEKLQALLQQATKVPKPRKPTKIGRAAREARLRQKRHRAAAKTARRRPVEE
jgi:ribosome-associated protein